MAKTVLGILPTRESAESAIDQLQVDGFNPQNFSVITQDTVVSDVPTASGSPVAEGTVSGATTGGVLGGLAGLLIGVGALAIPGVGSLLIGGPLAAALGLTGAAATTVSGAVTGAVAGGLVGALIGLGVPEETARLYETSIKEGGIVLAVPVDDGTEETAMSTLRKFGATQVITLNR